MVFASEQEERSFVTAHRGNRQLRPNERISEVDGYAHCVVCGERTEGIHLCITASGLSYELYPGESCACERAKQAKMNERNEREKLEDRRNIAFGEAKLFKKYTFATDNGGNPALTARVKGFVDRTAVYLNTPKDKRTDCRGMLLFGETGRGKTFMTAAACGALCEKGFQPYMRDVPTIVESMRTYGDNVVLEGLYKYPVWFLDDFGAESQSDFVQTKVYTLIEKAVEREIVLFINGNMRREELMKPNSTQHERIYSRLFEKCEMVHVQQPNDCRLMHAAERQGSM